MFKNLDLRFIYKIKNSKIKNSLVQNHKYFLPSNSFGKYICSELSILGVYL
ncbi:MAG: hypothetical protein UR78_C0007G0028 [Candidatus Moranbacteria bacterium GW2011_GWF2_35_39]|nr:MAG: hypothetical protein UR78_C0007G0028 [Candidatus Moranbacteria bacterium GW2011_GWF2_35_39]